MAVHKILVVAALVGSVASQLAGTELDTYTTQVPILRFLDSKNPDGSYTYGFESGDGTYKIETRLADGSVKGKYAYIDTDGILQETVYGGSSERGFETQIDGVVVAPPALVDETGLETNFVAAEERPARVGSNFANFKAKNFQTLNTNQVIDNNDVRIVNGRRVVLKKKLRVNPIPIPRTITLSPEVQRQQFQRSRKQQLKALEVERQTLQRLHHERYNGLTGTVNAREQSRSLQFQQRQVQPQQQLQQQIQPQQIFENHPSISRYNPQDGSYSLSYGR